jgi:hypothetical protein
MLHVILNADANRFPRKPHICYVYWMCYFSEWLVIEITDALDSFVDNNACIVFL